MPALVIKLILAHLIGDFLLQTGKGVKDKQERKHRSPFLYLHVFIHLVALAIVLQLNTDYWLGVVIIVITHYIIDLAKLLFTTEKNGQVLFFLDQIAHLLVITGVVHYYHPFEWDINLLFSPQVLLFIAFLIFVTYASAIFISVLLVNWKSESPNKAGRYIGMLERLFIFLFILLDYWQGIGFLLAAKSIFRFNDISKAEERTLAEYILVGTLLSFGIAIIAALGYQYLLERL